MPFTLSHPAAVIPFARGRLVPSALVIGSIAPDIPYFFFMMELRAETHRPLGMISVDLTLALFVYTAFHMLWKAPLTELSPRALRDRLPAPRPLLSPWLLPSLFIGIVTHVFWDGFTHHDHGFATELPWLVTTSFGGLELYRWLQYASGIAGALIIIGWLARWFKNTPAGTGTGRTGSGHTGSGLAARAASVRARLVAGALIVAGAVAGGCYGAVLDPEGGPAGDPGFHVRLVGGVVGVIAGLVVAVTVYSLGWRLTAGRTAARHEFKESPNPAGPESVTAADGPENAEGPESPAVLEGKVVAARAPLDDTTPVD